ncbi:MAG: cupin domain-containing protein [Deltaproteobacteria bacterium]|nr:cupin domain-containing protein [Deltaproteobacteria bacterium]
MNEANKDAYKGFLEDIDTFSSTAAPKRPQDTAAQEAQTASLGQRVRLVRQEKGLTVEDVAQRTGIPAEELNRIEDNEVSPPLGTLVRISKALHMQLGRFISTGQTKPFTVTRKADRRVIARFTSDKDDRYGYTYESLAPDKKDRHMEPFMVTLLPSTGKKELSTHAGQEFIYVLEGSLEVTLEEHCEVLQEGDSIYYDSTVPHLVRCSGEKQAVILAVLYTEDA